MHDMVLGTDLFAFLCAPLGLAPIRVDDGNTGDFVVRHPSVPCASLFAIISVSKYDEDGGVRVRQSKGDG